MGYYEDYKPEKDTVEVEPKKKSGFFGKFVALLLGFILGIISALGGLVGGGYLILNKYTVKQTFEKVNDLAGTKLDYSEYITETYANKTVWALFKEVVPMISKDAQEGKLTLQYLADISPFVEKTVDNLIKEADKNFGLPINKAELMSISLGKGDELFKFFGESIKDMELGKLMKKMNEEFSYEDTDSIMMQICYGVYGEDYELVDGKPEMAEGKKATTIGDLMNLESIMGKITVEGLNTNFKEDAKNSAMIRAFIWGPEGKTHEYNAVTQKPEWLPMVYTKNTETEITDVLGYKYTYSAGKFYNDATDRYIVEASSVSAMAKALDGATDPDYVLFDKDDTPLYDLRLSEKANEFIAYKHGTTEKVLNKPLTVQDLMNCNIESMFTDLPLSAVLGDEAYKDEILLALCFGTEGEDYDMVDGKPQMKEGKTETTIADLKKSGKVNELMDKMTLSTFLTPTDALTNYLVYGVENAHFIAGNPVTMLEKRLAVKVEGGTVTAYDVCGNPVTVTPTANANVYTYDENGTIYTVEVSNANKYTGAGKAEYNGIPYYYLKLDGNKVHYKKHTIADLSGEDSLVKSITKDLTIGDLMGEGGDSKLMDTISTWKVDDLKDKKKIESLKIGEVIEIDTSETSTQSKLIQKLSTWSISDLSDQEKIDELKLNEIMPIDESSPHILREIADSSIGDLPERLHSLKVSDVLADDEKSNRFTKHLGDVTVERLSSELLKLSVQQVYVDQIFESYLDVEGENEKRSYNGSVGGVPLGNDKSNWLSEENMHYYTYKSSSSLEQDDRFKYYTKPVADIIAEEGVTAETFDVNAPYATKYEFKPILQGTWKYLLRNGEGREDVVCYLSDIAGLVDNMTVNIQNTSLSDLNYDFKMGMTYSFLIKNLTTAGKTAAGISQSKLTIGDLTIKELSQYVEAVFENSSLLAPTP